MGCNRHVPGIDKKIIRHGPASPVSTTILAWSKDCSCRQRSLLIAVSLPILRAEVLRWVHTIEEIVVDGPCWQPGHPTMCLGS